jgi:hypothetical protein
LGLNVVRLLTCQPLYLPLQVGVTSGAVPAPPSLSSSSFSQQTSVACGDVTNTSTTASAYSDSSAQANGRTQSGSSGDKNSVDAIDLTV